MVSGAVSTDISGSLWSDNSTIRPLLQFCPAPSLWLIKARPGKLAMGQSQSFGAAVMSRLVSGYSRLLAYREYPRALVASSCLDYFLSQLNPHLANTDLSYTLILQIKALRRRRAQTEIGGFSQEGWI